MCIQNCEILKVQYKNKVVLKMESIKHTFE